jgi:hypothetical protein
MSQEFEKKLKEFTDFIGEKNRNSPWRGQHRSNVHREKIYR